MRVQLVRHATLIVEYGGRRLMVDPMLDDAGARGPIEDSPNPRKNPLVALPAAAEELVKGLDAALVTHTHSDHWDRKAAEVLPKELPLFCQPEDEAKFIAAGFTRVQVVAKPASFEGIEITRTGGQHGIGELAKMLAPVSGFVLRAPGEPTLYIAGDTLWCGEVEGPLREFTPAAVVLNAGGARFLEGERITMSEEDVIQVCHCAPNAQVIAVHMEAINHCLLTRSDLAFQLEAERVIGQVAIPQDGDWIEFGR